MRAASRSAQRVMLLVAIGATAAVYAAILVHPTAGFHFDSWTYSDLARSVFSDFYRPITTRDAHGVDGYSRAFPPLWPTALAMTGARPELQAPLSLMCAVAILLPMWWLSRVLTGRRALATPMAALAWLSLMSFEGFRAEVRGGGSMPAALFLVLSAVALLARPPSRQSARSAVATGALFGLAALTRFDILVFVGLMFVWAGMDGRPRRLLLAMAAAFVVTISPWILYSVARFGVLWATDNWDVVINARPSWVLDALPPRETLWSDPLLWFTRVGRNVLMLPLRVAQAMLAVPLALLALGAFIGARRVRSTGAAPRMETWLVISGVAALLPQVLTGYFETRYFSLMLVLFLLAGMSVASRTISRLRAAYGVAALFAATTAVVAESSAIALAWTVRADPFTPAVVARFKASYGGQGILDVTQQCTRLGVVTGVQFVCRPSDWNRMTDEERGAFLRRFGVTHRRLDPAGGAGQLEVVPIDAVGPPRG